MRRSASLSPPEPFGAAPAAAALFAKYLQLSMEEISPGRAGGGADVLNPSLPPVHPQFCACWAVQEHPLSSGWICSVLLPPTNPQTWQMRFCDCRNKPAVGEGAGSRQQLPVDGTGRRQSGGENRFGEEKPPLKAEKCREEKLLHGTHPSHASPAAAPPTLSVPAAR